MERFSRETVKKYVEESTDGFKKNTRLKAVGVLVRQSGIQNFCGRHLKKQKKPWIILEVVLQLYCIR